MKFAIVTPSYNRASLIRETIESVLNQTGNFSLHYHVQDGGSSDGTEEVLQEYAARVNRGEYAKFRPQTRFTWTSEKDSGMYDAINRGFRAVEGDVLAWINSDDFYLPGAFATMDDLFTQFAGIDWVKGVTRYIDEAGNVIFPGSCYLFDPEWIRKGIYGNEAYFLEQDSVFWRRSLWDKSGGISSGLRLAGDFELWTKFAKTSQPVSVGVPVSAFRKVKGQLSQDLEKYRAEMTKALGGVRERHPFLQFFFRVWNRIPNPVAQLLFLTLNRPSLPIFQKTSSGKWTLGTTRRFSIKPSI